MQHHRRVQDQAAVAICCTTRANPCGRARWGDLVEASQYFIRHSAPQQNAGLPPLHIHPSCLRIVNLTNNKNSYQQHGPQKPRRPLLTFLQAITYVLRFFEDSSYVDVMSKLETWETGGEKKYTCASKRASEIRRYCNGHTSCSHQITFFLAKTKNSDPTASNNNAC